MAAGCQIEDCGVTAIGRCRRCRRAFCMSHQGIDGPRRHMDLCATCMELLLADRESHPTTRAESPRWLLANRGLELLRNAGVAPVGLVRTVVSHRLIGADRVHYEPVGSAYLLGEVEWMDEFGLPGRWPTGLRQAPGARPGWGEAVRLREVPGGWELVGGGTLVDEAGAAAAVRRLASLAG